MLDAEEHDELRSLQARAYGRDASLTASEAARLRELEERRVARPDEVVGGDPAVRTSVDSGEPAPREHPAAAPRTLFAGELGDAVEPEDDDGPADSTERRPAVLSLRSLLREHWRPAAIAAVAVLLVGVGVGWLAFGSSRGEAVALTSVQQGWQDELVSGGLYDPGSIRALAVEEGAVVWTATKGERERTCLILRAGDVAVPNCELTERVAETGVYGSIMLETDEELHRQVNVQMLLTAAGQAAVAISTYDYDPGTTGVTYANEAEAKAAERLIDDGFDPNSLWVVGYDGDVPIWTAVQMESQNHCLIYDGSRPDAPMTCADPETMQEQASSLILTVVDAETGAVSHLEMASSSGPAYLVITREGGVSGAGGD